VKVPKRQLQATFHCGRVLPSKGFSLFEVSVVILVFGVLLLGVAVPQINRSFAAFRLESSAQSIAADIRELQQRNLGEELDEGSGTISIKFYPSVDKYHLKKPAHPLPVILKSVQLPSSVDLVEAKFGSSWELSFSKTGAPFPGGGTVTLQDRVSRKFKYVIVAAITGRVRVSDCPPEKWEISP
jgi:prepilin-type N-terminal cleavage/methylation domain-containing protein